MAKNLRSSSLASQCHGQILEWGKQTYLMGILNVTPDSFYDGNRYLNAEDAIRHAHAMAAEGADIIDIGGESSRPGASPISAEEELKRVLPVIRRLVNDLDIPLSIDTYKAEVARKALDEGVNMVNDISSLHFDPSMAQVVSEYGVPVILMHMQGVPVTMQTNPRYEDVVVEIMDFFKHRIREAESRGIRRDNIILDPGIGFGKTTEHNLKILAHIERLKSFHLPVVVGPSRKSFLGNLTDEPAESRLIPTAAVVAYSILRKVDIVRVHDVREMRSVATVIEAIQNTH